jgi:hypothetical protein
MHEAVAVPTFSSRLLASFTFELQEPVCQVKPSQLTDSVFV